MRKFNLKYFCTVTFGMLCMMQTQSMFARLLTGAIRNRPVFKEFSQTETTMLMFFCVIVWICGFLFLIHKKTNIAGIGIAISMCVLGTIQLFDNRVYYGDPFFLTDPLQNFAIGIAALYLGISGATQKDPDRVARPV